MVVIPFLTGYPGFFVVAPNLLGHAWRRGTDYRVSTLAEDLRPYFATDTPYDVIISHSLGGLVTLCLFPFLPKTKETTVILVDPPLELTAEQFQQGKNRFLKEIEDAKTADEHMSEHPAWSRGDSMLRALGVYMCDRTVVKGIFEVNIFSVEIGSITDKFIAALNSITSHMLLVAG
jgi:pimeloyl-ACP methyl ester carboxylesterase